MSKQKRQYLKYLKSGHWKTLRQQAFQRDGFRCIKCGSGHVIQAHHRRYRKDLRLCTVDDLETLCKRCHREHHKEKRRLRKLNRQKRNSPPDLISLILDYSAT